MTQVLITINTPLSASLHQRGAGIQYNLEKSIWGQCDEGRFGIEWQMDTLEAHGLKGVFFVDSLPRLVFRFGMLEKIIQPILDRGHEVQMHIQTDWLDWVIDSPTGSRRGDNLAKFSADDQIMLLGLCSEMLENAGAPKPIAFRAAKFGADDNSLRALAEIGVQWDSSFNVAHLNQHCKITLPTWQTSAVKYHGVIELPVSGLLENDTTVRSAHVCALSAREMRAALLHSAEHDRDTFVIVANSFGMLSRDLSRPNHPIMRRFEAMCSVIEKHPDLISAGFRDLDPAIAQEIPAQQPRLGPNRLRTGLRVAEHVFYNWLNERKLRPA